MHVMHVTGFLDWPHPSVRPATASRGVGRREDMTFIRRNVWELGGDWPDQVLWYARGVAAMKARALDTPTSWRFYAGIHGFSSARWRALSAR